MRCNYKMGRQCSAIITCNEAASFYLLYRDKFNNKIIGTNCFCYEHYEIIKKFLSDSLIAWNHEVISKDKYIKYMILT